MKSFKWIDIELDHFQASSSRQQAIKNSINQKSRFNSSIELYLQHQYLRFLSRTFSHTLNNILSFFFHFHNSDNDVCLNFLSCLLLLSNSILSMMSMLFWRNRVMQNHDEWRSCRHRTHWELFILMKLMSLIFSINTRICVMIFVSTVRRRCDDYLDIAKWWSSNSSQLFNIKSTKTENNSEKHFLKNINTATLFKKCTLVAFSKSTKTKIVRSKKIFVNTVANFLLWTTIWSKKISWMRSSELHDSYKIFSTNSSNNYSTKKMWIWMIWKKWISIN